MRGASGGGYSASGTHRREHSAVRGCATCGSHGLPDEGKNDIQQISHTWNSCLRILRIPERRARVSNMDIVPKPTPYSSCYTTD